MTSTSRVARLALVIGALGATGASAMWLGGRPASSAGKFQIRGTVAGPLAPGENRLLNLKLTNRGREALRVRAIHVRGRVDDPHGSLGCTMRLDFKIRQLRRPIDVTLPPRSTRSLSSLGVSPLPRLRMRSRPHRNRDVCRSATVSLFYRGWTSFPGTRG